MKISNGQVFLCWLKSRRKIIGYLAVVISLFFIICILHRYQWQVAGYTSLLALILGVCLGGWDFRQFAAKHQQLTILTNRFSSSRLPKADHLIEEDYLAIIAEVETRRRLLETMVENLSRDAEEYYTLWAHQIKTPIAAMDLLLQSSRGNLKVEFQQSLEQELFRIGQYTDMVLHYQRLASMENDLVFKHHRVATLAKKAGKNCATLFIHKGLALDIQETDDQIVTDEKWFCFVLEQLYTNAVKYADKDAVRVYWRESQILVVEDHGCGISAEDLPRVFERGFTGSIGRTERSSTGIGLYLCHRIMTRLGFDLSIEATPCTGTRVLLNLRQNSTPLD